MPPICLHGIVHNFYPTGVGNLYFSTWFMKNVLYEWEKVKLLSKRHFVENKTDYAHVLKMQ